MRPLARWPIVALLLLAAPGARADATAPPLPTDAQAPADAGGEHRAWHGRGFGLQLEAGFAALLRDDPQGSAFASDEGFGGRLSFDLSRLVDGPLGLEAPLGLTLGLLWYHVELPSDAGTDAVQVQTSFDYLALPLQVGWELGRGAWRLIPYVAAGPAFTRVAVDYTIADPVAAAAGAKPQEKALSDLLPGAAYGAGASFGWRAEESAVGITGRLELLRFRRGPNDDLSLGFALGLLL